MGQIGDFMCSESGDGWHWGKYLVVGAATVVSLHSMGVSGPLETHLYELGKENLMPITAAEDTSPHTDPNEYSSEIHKAKYSVAPSGSTLSFMDIQYFVEWREGRTKLSVTGMDFMIAH